MTNGYKLRTGLNSTRDEKSEKNLIEEVLVSNSSLVTGLSEASGVKFSWGEGFQEILKTNLEKYRNDVGQGRKIHGNLRIGGEIRRRLASPGGAAERRRRADPLRTGFFTVPGPHSIANLLQIPRRKRRLSN